MIVLDHALDAAIACGNVADLVRPSEPEDANTSTCDGKETPLPQLIAAAPAAPASSAAAAASSCAIW